MRQPMLFVSLLLVLPALASRADDDSATAPVPAAQPATSAAPTSATHPAPEPPLETRWQLLRSSRAPAVATPAAAVTATPPANDAGAPVQVSAEAKWQLAGYNNNEVIYTIFLTSHDPRIARCNIMLSGFYFEKGEKLPISDRQSLTVFPEQRVPVGNWQGMDEKSGATYEVKCHPL